jgi:hypothetical protein
MTTSREIHSAEDPDPANLSSVSRVSRALSILLIAGGAVALARSGGNDWYFIGVRPEAARGDPMPIPAAHRTCESLALRGLGSGPYDEELRLISVVNADPRRLQTIGDADLLITLDGNGRVSPSTGDGSVIRTGDCFLAQPGSSIMVSDTGAGPLQVRSFTVTPAAHPSINRCRADSGGLTPARKQRPGVKKTSISLVALFGQNWPCGSTGPIRTVSPQSCVLVMQVQCSDSSGRHETRERSGLGLRLSPGSSAFGQALRSCQRDRRRSHDSS